MSLSTQEEKENQSLVVSRLKSIGEDLTKEVMKDGNRSAETCNDLLKAIEDLIPLPSSSKNSKSKLKAKHLEVTSLLKESMIGKTMTRAVRSLKRNKRDVLTSANGDTMVSSITNSNTNASITSSLDGCQVCWEDTIMKANSILEQWKTQVAQEQKDAESQKVKKETRKKKRKKANDNGGNNTSDTKNSENNDGDGDGDGGGLPKNSSEYRQRLITQNKEMYKDPPVLPPPTIPIYINIKPENKEQYAPPKRNKKTGELTFAINTKLTNDSEDETNSTINFDDDDEQYQQKLSKLLETFHPNRTPEEILRSGSFGGTYFRPIISAVNNVHYTKPDDVLESSVLSEWIEGLDKRTMLVSSTYRPTVNKYKVKCGGSLGMWESSGWISHIDPYGWFQWYCRFYQGRRTGDDVRQIERWCKCAGVKGRFRSQLCNKIFAAGGLEKVEDVTISPVIRQTLLHWGLEITRDVLVKHGKRVGKL